MVIKRDDPDDLLTPSDLGRKLVVALRSVTDPQALMQDIADRSIATLRGELARIDKATDLLHQDSVRVPTDIDRAVGQVALLFESKLQRVEDVIDERFARIDTAFVERDKRTEQLALATSTAAQQLALAGSTAIAAALQAQKEAADKSEKNANEATRALQALFQTAMASLSTQVGDVKGRLDKGEGRTTGIGDGWGYLVGAVGAVVGVVAVVELLLRHSG